MTMTSTDKQRTKDNGIGAGSRILVGRFGTEEGSMFVVYSSGMMVDFWR